MALKTFDVIFGCYICLISWAIKFCILNWFDVMSGSKNTGDIYSMNHSVGFFLSKNGIIGVQSLEWYETKPNYYSSSKLWIVAFASLYCKSYEYSLFILGGGRWKYDTKIRDIYLTMVLHWLFFRSLEADGRLFLPLCFTHCVSVNV